MTKLPAKAAAAPPANQVPPFFSAQQIELIKRQICPGASDDELKMFLWDCERSRLDPFARQIYSIERNEKYRDQHGNWKTRKKRTTQVSIDGFRLIAERTGDYAGQLGPQWCGDDGVWTDIWRHEQPPIAARVAALRKDFQQPLWTTALFREYAPYYDGKLSGLWAKMPAVMIGKCAEALALRRAFPRELSGFYTTDEMMQTAPAGDPVSPALSLRDELNDAIPDYGSNHAELSPPVSQAEGSAAAGTESKPSVSAAPLSIEDLAREAAKRGQEHLVKFFNSRTSKEKDQLRKIEHELVALYPTNQFGSNQGE